MTEFNKPSAYRGTKTLIPLSSMYIKINTAVKFLENPKVRQSPLATRKAFLKKKGLTDEEVQLAIQRSGSTEEVLRLTPVLPPHPVHAPQLVPVSHSPAGYRWRDYGALTIIMVGIKYILPFIMSSREDKKHLQRMENNIAAMSGTLTQTVSQLQQTLVSVQELLVQQQQKIQELSQEMAAAEVAGISLATEFYLISFLSLLHARKQFPSTPTVSKIPSWQIPLKPPSVPGSPSVNSSSDISPVSNESANFSPVKDGHQNDTLGGPDGAHGINGDVGTTLPLDLKDQVRMEVQGEEEIKNEEDLSNVKAEEDGLSMQTEDRRGGDGQINEQVDKLRRPEGASNESEVD
uniref:Peroxisomal membrane protein PEX14 n=1 Tax=Mola mola TaxID=94237 RepID=A0A3Q4B3G7_MOLML